jgi:hypothetical protein
MGTPAAPVAESDPSAPLSSNPSQLTPAQRRLKDMLAEISRPLEMDFERPVMFAQGQSRLVLTRILAIGCRSRAL